MEKQLFLGDEAIAQAAIDAGISGVYAYPGTPSTEITEYIQGSAVAKERGIHSRWSTNEKTAMEAALGMSYAGKRSLCCMKHVGLNVAADCFMNAGMSGINGGMIIITADDPSMHSSQNEQDNRVYGNFAMIPMLEPSSQQEAYDMVYEGFELSEKLGYPILMRITTRMAHSRAGVVTRLTAVSVLSCFRLWHANVSKYCWKRRKGLPKRLKVQNITSISMLPTKRWVSLQPVLHSTICRRIILTGSNIRY